MQILQEFSKIFALFAFLRKFFARELYKICIPSFLRNLFQGKWPVNGDFALICNLLENILILFLPLNSFIQDFLYFVHLFGV